VLGLPEWRIRGRIDGYRRVERCVERRAPNFGAPARFNLELQGTATNYNSGHAIRIVFASQYDHGISWEALGACSRLALERIGSITECLMHVLLSLPHFH